MTRPIEFRAWDKKQNEMLQPFTTEDFFSDSGMLYNLHSNCIFMQFTGLLDKNGKKIFEGDIIQFSSVQIRDISAPELRVIKWLDEEGQFNWVRTDTLETTSGWSFCKQTAEKYCEIIGNIYENSELLK